MKVSIVRSILLSHVFIYRENILLEKIDVGFLAEIIRYEIPRAQKVVKQSMYVCCI